MNTKKLGVAAVSAVLLAASLTACSASSNDNRGPATDKCPDGTVTLSILRIERNAPTDAQISQYQQTNPCVQFKVDEVPFGQVAEKISVSATSNNPPDIIGYDGPNTQAYASQGVLLPLDEYLPKGWYDDVLPATRTEHSWNGAVYSPGLHQDALALFYNKTMTDALGINPPTALKDAWTWDEARKAFAACQVGGSINPSVWGLAPSRLGGGTPGASYRDLLFLRSMGDPKAPEGSDAYKTFWALSPDGKDIDGWLNTPEAARGAQFYKDLFNGSAPVTSKTGIPNAMIDGKACFDIETTQGVKFLKDANVAFKWGVTPLPYFKSPIVHTGAVTVGVSAKSKHAAEAAKFVVAISTGDLLRDFAIKNNRIPVLKSVRDQIPALSEYPTSLFTAEIEQWGVPRPPTPAAVQYTQFVSDALRNIAYGADPKAALNDAVKAIQPALPH